MLVAPTSSWRGTDGRGMTHTEFARWVNDLKLGGSFKPQFVTIHNTAAPNAKQWQSSPVIQRLRNLSDFYIKKGWHGGPHAFIDDEKIWLFTPLDKQGTHSPSWNRTAWGLEMVGDYNKESFTSGFGADVADNAAFATAVLLKKLNKGATGSTVRFHKEDLATDHDCPGRNVIKSAFLQKVQEYLTDLKRPVGAMAYQLPRKSFDVLMTEFASEDDPQDSAYGGKVNGNAYESALPARVPANQRAIRIHFGGKDVVSKVNDVGPHNKTDDYWYHGTPPAAIEQHRNGELAENRQVPTNEAGLDSTPAVFDALGIKGLPGTRSAQVSWEFTTDPVQEPPPMRVASDEEPRPALAVASLLTEPAGAEHEVEDEISPRKLIKSRTFWGSVTAAVSSIVASLTDWRVLAVLLTFVTVLACLYIVWRRYSADDIEK